MFSNAKLTQSALVVVALGIFAMAPSTASAGIFGSIEKAVTHPAKLVKDVEKDVAGAAKDVTHPKLLLKDTKDDGMKVLHKVGGVVGDVYDDAAKVAKDIPVAKDFRPLMRDAARAARSSEGEVAAVAGGALAVATGGASYAATQAGGWGYAAFAGKREIKAAPGQLKSAVRSLQQ